MRRLLFLLTAVILVACSDNKDEADLKRQEELRDMYRVPGTPEPRSDRKF